MSPCHSCPQEQHSGTWLSPCPQVGLSPYPNSLHFPRTWLSPCPDSPRHQGWLSPHPSTSSPLTVAVLTPGAQLSPCLSCPCVPAIPTSRVCHPRVSLSPCPQVRLSHTPGYSCPRVPPAGTFLHTQIALSPCSIHPRVPPVPTQSTAVPVSRNRSVPKSHPSPSPCPTGPRVSPSSRVRRAQTRPSPRLIPVQDQALLASSRSPRRGN